VENVTAQPTGAHSQYVPRATRAGPVGERATRAALPAASGLRAHLEGWLSGFRMVSGSCWVLSVLEVSSRCQRLSGLSVCEDAYTLSRAVGAVGLSGCRVLGGVGWCRAVGAVSGRAALICGVRLAPRFNPNNSKQGVEESNRNMHTLKYMRLKISLNPRSSVRLRPFKALNWPKKAL